MHSVHFGSMYQEKAQYQININSRDTTPICFFKNVPTSESICAKVKICYNGEIIFAKFHNL
jgi:hypothetical protein